MKSSNTFTIAIVFGILGIAIGLIQGIIVGLLVSAWMDDDFEELAEYQEHHQVEVLEAGRRGDEVYLKFRNSGEYPVDDMYFEIEVRGGDGVLRREYEVRYAKWVDPGEVEETLLKPYDDEGGPVDLEGALTVDYKYGWRTIAGE